MACDDHPAHNLHQIVIWWHAGQVAQLRLRWAATPIQRQAAISRRHALSASRLACAGVHLAAIEDWRRVDRCRFRAPLRSCDRFKVDVRVGAATAARLVLEQQIVRLLPDSEPQVTHHHLLRRNH